MSSKTLFSTKTWAPFIGSIRIVNQSSGSRDRTGDIKRTVSGVNPIIVRVEVVVEDVSVAKPQRRGPRVQVRPPVVRHRDGDGDVLRSVAVRMTDERGFPVVVQLRVGDGDARTAVRDVEKTIVVVLWRKIHGQ